MDRLLVYLPKGNCPSVAEIEELAGGAIVQVRSEGKEGHSYVVSWGATRTFLHSMPASEIQEDLDGFLGFLEETGLPSGDPLWDRVRASKVILKFVPWSGSEHEPLELARAIASENEGLYVVDFTVTESDGEVLWEPDSGEDEPVDEGEDACEPPNGVRVARRALVLTAIVYRGFLEHSEEDKNEREGQRAAVLEWIEAHALDEELEDDERILLDTPVGDLEEQLAVNAFWRSEGLGVLAWALGTELDPHDRNVDAAGLSGALGFLDTELPEHVTDPYLRDPEELEWMAKRLLGIHWRLRQFSIKPESMDFKAFSEDCWFGSFDLEGIDLADSDLAIGGTPIADCDPEIIDRCQSVALERHQAINWLLGYDPTYSEADTST